jgi:CDP-glucose 4,6-dehydratase
MTTMPFQNIYSGKKVLLTGHTGLKGAWLAEWLLSLGADVTGAALPPPTTPSLFDQLGLANRLHHNILDIRDADATRRLVEAARPDIIFHLAAQPLVRLSYKLPLETYATNVMGTAHILDAARRVATPENPCAIVAITTDKCYENREWLHSYREEDALGGHDPYSSSKGAAELVISAYRRSYFSGKNSPVKLASARAGNVIGGGDWALDRIVPDCVRALQNGEKIPVRNKVSTRPWQHVLEPLGGYLHLGCELLRQAAAAERGPSIYESAFNFGPALQSNRTVAELVAEILKHWPGEWIDKSDPRAVHEATLLNLATDKAWHLLKWQPVWPFEKTIAETTNWYREAHNGQPAAELTRRQIAAYAADARRLSLPWAE